MSFGRETNPKDQLEGDTLMKSKMMNLVLASAFLLATCACPAFASAPVDGGGGPGSDVTVASAPVDGGGGPGSDITVLNVFLAYLGL